MKTLNNYSRIFLAGLLAILLTLTGLLPVQAEGVTTADTTGGSYSDGYITLPFSQTWSGSAPDSSVQYTLEPIEYKDGSYTYDTPAYAESGRIQYAFDGVADQKSTDEIRTTLSGNTQGQITFRWKQPGVYVFQLQCSQTGTSNYTYSGTVYRIRVYVRSTEESAFVTAQVVGDENSEANGKVSALTFAHSYTAPVTPRGGDNPTPASDGGSNSTSNSTNTVAQVTESGSTGTILDNIVQFLTEYGNAGEGTSSVTESGSHQNAFTGDDSNMILYGMIAILAIITLTVWMMQRKRA